MWGEAGHGLQPTGPKTARTSEGYGEATVATAEKMLRLLTRLTSYIPSMSGWSGLWNLDADATFLGPALWGFSSAMAYPPHSSNIFTPGTPFVNAAEEALLEQSL